MNKRMLMAFAVCFGILSCQFEDAFGQNLGSKFTASRDAALDDSPRRRPLTEDELVRLRIQEMEQTFDAETSLDEGRSIHPELMRSVVDNTIGIRYEEREAYFRTLHLAHSVPHRSLERYAAELKDERREAVPSYRGRSPKDFPQFIDLFTQPEFYRGRPVTIRGVMRKLTKFDVGQNKSNLDDVYEGWVYTPDCQGNPTVVVFTSKDERLKVTGDLQEEVHFTGYFFKMYGYNAYDTQRKAPLILAGDVECIPRARIVASTHVGIEWYAATMLCFLIVLYSLWQMTRRSASPQTSQLIEPDFNHFPPLEHPAINPLLAHSVIETEDS